ncbi:MAG TPA: anti-sigma factor antagonist [Chloroflexia bacterium]|nr:anti-sigma factor antagonist [Chloroflexia bacterium]
MNQLPDTTLTVVAISGELDGKTSPLAQDKVMPLVRENSQLILDLAKVAYMSSAGLRFLLSIGRQLPDTARMVLVGLSQQLMDTMRVTGFLELFEVADTLEQGKAALA